MNANLGLAASLVRAEREKPISLLHLEESRLRRRVSLKALISVEMIRRNVEQHRNIAIEGLRQVDLVAG